MKKFLLLACVISLTVLPDVHATQVNMGTTGTTRRIIQTSLSVNIAAGSLIWMGTFASPLAITFDPMMTVLQNVTKIQADGGWTQFGVDPSTGSPVAGQSSTLAINAALQISGSVTDVAPSIFAPFFNNKNMYLWIFNGTTPTLSTQMGIFRKLDNLTADWKFPAADAVPNTVSLGTTPTSAPDIAAIGGAGTGATNTTTVLKLAAAVPEPSSAILLGSGLFGLLSLRRRGVRA